MKEKMKKEWKVKELQCVILAGGLGTRLSEETNKIPKPLVEIGGMPILWHIMKIYYSHGVKNFIICGGYKCHLIKEFFRDYDLIKCDYIFESAENKKTLLKSDAEDWRVKVIDTGLHTMTGGRLSKIRQYLNPEAPFFMTYGDGLSDINIEKLLSFHNSHEKMATVTAVSPPARFGALELDGSAVKGFVEKPIGDGLRINGGFFVLEQSTLDYIKGDDVSWENEPMQMISTEGKMNAYIHDGFWLPMDTLRDKKLLERAWGNDEAKWKNW